MKKKTRRGGGQRGRRGREKKRGVRAAKTCSLLKEHNVFGGLFCLALQAPLAPQRRRRTERVHGRLCTRPRHGRNASRSGASSSSLDQDVEHGDEHAFDLEQRSALVGHVDDVCVQGPPCSRQDTNASAWEPNQPSRNVSRRASERARESRESRERVLKWCLPVRSLVVVSSLPSTQSHLRLLGGTPEALRSLSDRAETSFRDILCASPRVEANRR